MQKNAHNRFDIRCLEIDCDRLFRNIYGLIDHLIDGHGISIEQESFVFKSFSGKFSL